MTHQPEPLAHSLACESQNDADLARVIEVWPELPEALRHGLARWRELPEAIRRAILALVENAGLTEH